MTIPATVPLGEAEKGTRSNVLPIAAAREARERAVTAYSLAATETPFAVGVRRSTTDITFAPRIAPKRAPAGPPSPFDEAFWRIAATSEENLSPVERSNTFDEWKDCLLEIAASLGDGATDASAIVGALLQASRKKDVTDFNKQQIEALREATGRLRVGRVSALDAHDTIRRLREQRLSISLPLARMADDPDLNPKLDAIIQRFTSE